MATLIRPKAWGRTKPALGGGVNWGHPLAQSLISAVPFAEGGGRPRDFAQNLMLGAGVRTFPASGWAPTTLGMGMVFSGASDEAIKVGLAGIIKSTDGATFVAWVTYSGTSGTSDYLFNAGASNSQFQLFSWLTGNGVYGAWLPNAAPFDQANSAGNPAFPASGILHMVAFVHKPNGNGAGRLFFDGKLVATGTTGSNASGIPATDIYMANNASGGNPAHGTIPNALIYRRALTDSEIAWLYAEPYAWAVQPNRLRFIGSSTNIKTVNGLAKASVKTVDGLAIGSVKTIDGLA